MVRIFWVFGSIRKFFEPFYFDGHNLGTIWAQEKSCAFLFFCIRIKRVLIVELNAILM
jgi:hypothetical protein